MAKPKATAVLLKKIRGDNGPIKPSNQANVLQNANPTTPTMADPQIMPAPPVADRHVVVVASPDANLMKG